MIKYNLDIQIIAEQICEKRITVHSANELTGALVACNIRRVFGEYVADELVYRVVPFFREVL